jgi:hypothetical protein
MPNAFLWFSVSPVWSSPCWWSTTSLFDDSKSYQFIIIKAVNKCRKPSHPSSVLYVLFYDANSIKLTWNSGFCTVESATAFICHTIVCTDWSFHCSIVASTCPFDRGLGLRNCSVAYAYWSLYLNIQVIRQNKISLKAI